MFLHSDPPHPCFGVCCCFTVLLPLPTFPILSPAGMIHPKLIRICFRSRILTKKSILSRLFYNVLHMPGDLQPKIQEFQLYRFTYHSKSVQFLPRLFSKLPFFVRRQCRACATKIPWIPECIRRRAACSKLVRAMGGRYGEGSRRRPCRPGWRSPSISSKPGANGRGEGT